MATRLYFASTGVLPLIVIEDGSWTNTGSVTHQRLNHVKGTSANTTLGAKTSSATDLRCHHQAVSFPMNAGISFTSATVKCYIMAVESAANDNITSRLNVRIVNRGGNIVRVTLLNIADYSTATEWNTALRNKAFADGDTVGAGYTTVDGDRLVVEIGHSDASGVSISGQIQVGEATGSDLLENETATTGDPWIEFSPTITFQTEALKPYIINPSCIM